MPEIVTASSVVGRFHSNIWRKKKLLSLLLTHPLEAETFLRNLCINLWSCRESRSKWH